MRATARWINGLLTLLMFLMVGTAAGLTWFRLEIDRPGPLTKPKLVKVKSGFGTRAIANLLEEQGVISSRQLFLAYHLSRTTWAALRGDRAEPLKAGDYQFEAGDSIRAVVAKIGRGKSVLYSVTIPEGLTSHAIVERLKADPGLTGAIENVPPEGFLRPETYLVPRLSDRQMVIDLMLDAQRKYLTSAWAKRQENLPFTDVSEALILASIVQRETGPNDQPARIASVFVNRLRRGMRLQSDPTILYGRYGSKVDWASTIYRSDIDKKTTHNTYQIGGLPPTPICNPGAVAIEAVLNPARTEDLYFVADGKGGHIFSRTNAEHRRAVLKWRQIEKTLRTEADDKPRPAKSGANSPSVGPAASGEPDDTATVMSSLGFPLPSRKPRRP